MHKATEIAGLLFAVIITIGIAGCIGEPIEELECASPYGLAWRTVEHVDGHCSHMDYPRSMEPYGGTADDFGGRECSVEVGGSIVSEQLGHTLFAHRTMHFEDDGIWEHWIMVLEDQRSGDICIEQYRVDYVPREL